MGCGGSRLGGAAGARANEGGVVPLPEGIRPLLRRRLEEMKKRSHASVLKGSQTQSQKELLRHGSSEDGEEAEEKEDSLKLSAKVAPSPDHHVEEKKEVIYEKVSSINGVKEGGEVVKKQDEKTDDVISIKKEGNDYEDIIVKKQGYDGLDHDDDHDEGRMSSFDERMICPGSPSFRVYCINVTSSDDEDDGDDDKEKDGEDKRKAMETESVIIEPKETTSAQQNESIVKKQKKERKGKRFGMALPRKYLANVTAPCMGNNTQSRVVQEKSSQ